MDQVLSTPLEHAPRPLSFSILRVPFFLEPNYDETTPFVESNRDRLLKKWGGPKGWERQKAHHNLKGRGLEAGIPHFNLDRLASNTMASHRLVQHVGKTYGLHISEAVYDRLNVYYFVQGHALNDRPRLAKAVSDEIAKHVVSSNSPSADEILNFLNGDGGRKEIENAVEALQELGIHGIPKFIIEGQTVVDGAAHSQTFVNIFREIEQRGHVQSGPVFGNILGISPDVVQAASHGRRIESSSM